MATIGFFTKNETGYTGSVRTLTVNAKARFAAAEKEKDNAPDYRVFAGTAEIGAAWKKTSEARARVHLGQARRSELPGTDLRQPGRDRGRQADLCPHLVPPQRQLSRSAPRRPALEAGRFAVYTTPPQDIS